MSVTRHKDNNSPATGASPALLLLVGVLSVSFLVLFKELGERLKHLLRVGIFGFHFFTASL